jgi:hypothetical protein
MGCGLEQGQLIEECYPPGCLTQDEELEIASSSFPDSISQHQNWSSIHDCIFFFQFRRQDHSQLVHVSSSERFEDGGVTCSEEETFPTSRECLQREKKKKEKKKLKRGVVFM